MSIMGEEVEVEGEADSEVVRALAERICALEKELLVAAGRCELAELHVARLQGEVRQLSHVARRRYCGGPGSGPLEADQLTRLYGLEVGLLKDTVARQQARECQLQEELLASRRSSSPPALPARSPMSVTETRLRRALARAQAEASCLAAGESVRLVLQFEPLGQQQPRLDVL
eukprot:EG_transcript_20358